MFKRRRRRSLAVDLLGGIASGLFASWVMERAHKRIWRFGSKRVLEREKQAMAGEPATIKVAETVAKPLGKRLSREEKKKGGELVHYGYGAAWGAAFGVLSRRLDLGPLGGTLFGVALWLVSDELLVPLFGFSKSPREYPGTVHLKGLASHVVYGLSLGEAQSLLRARYRSP